MYRYFYFGYVRLPQLEYYFSCFASFFLLFLFCYLLLNTKRTIFKIWAIEVIREDFCVAEIKGARLGDPLNQVFKILNV